MTTQKHGCYSVGRCEQSLGWIKNRDDSFCRTAVELRAHRISRNWSWHWNTTQAEATSSVLHRTDISKQYVNIFASVCLNFWCFQCVAVAFRFIVHLGDKLGLKIWMEFVCVGIGTRDIPCEYGNELNVSTTAENFVTSWATTGVMWRANFSQVYCRGMSIVILSYNVYLVRNSAFSCSSLENSLRC
jgi:hypothetical protein